VPAVGPAGAESAHDRVTSSGGASSSLDDNDSCA
jgi:hypothetical protein